MDYPGTRDRERYCVRCGFIPHLHPVMSVEDSVTRRAWHANVSDTENAKTCSRQNWVAKASQPT